MNASLNKWDYINIVFLVLVNLSLTDLLDSNLFKTIISFLPFTILLILYINKPKHVFYKVFLVYIFAFPFSPRDIVLVQQGTSLKTFISFTNLDIGFLSLSLLSIILFTIIECSKLGLIPKMIQFFIFYLLSFICYSILFNFGDFYLNFFISDLKPFLIFFFGYFFGLCIYKRFHNIWNQIFFKSLLILLFVFFIKTIFYITYDLYVNNYNTSFSTLPYLFIPVLYLAFFSNDLKKRNWIIAMAFISSISLSRGYFLMLGVLYLLLPIFFTKKKNFKKIFKSYIIFSGLLIFLFSFSKMFLSDQINVFLEYKLNFFTVELFSGNTDLNRSTLIRVFEFLNITDDLMKSPINFFFGKGLGGYFQFKEYSLPIPLSTDAFSDSQLILNKYFRPHTFINSALLKGGLFLLIGFSITNIKTFIYSFKSFKRNENQAFVLFSGIFSLLFLFYFWIPEFLFLNGLIIGYVRKHKRNSIL